MKLELMRFIFSTAAFVLLGTLASSSAAGRAHLLPKSMHVSCGAGALAEFNVLLIGNSFSANNDGPQVLEQLLLQTRCFGRVSLKSVIRLGGRLSGFNSKDLPPLTDEWDVVILQDNSRAYEWGTLEGLKSYAKIVEQVTLKYSGRVLLIETWPTLTHPETYAGIEKHFYRMHRHTGVAVVRVGAHFYAPRGFDRNLLYSRDGKHPSKLGTALYMCILLGSLLDQYDLPSIWVTPEMCAKSNEFAYKKAA